MSQDNHPFLTHPEFLMTSTPLPAGVVHLHRGIVLSDRPVPRQFASSDRRVPDGSGIALGVIVSLVFFAALGGIAWGLHAAGVVLP